MGRSYAYTRSPGRARVALLGAYTRLRPQSRPQYPGWQWQNPALHSPRPW
jgi:hypothetical protein